MTSSLIHRLEFGSGSDRELDALILCKLAAPEGAYVQQSRFNGEWCVYEKDRPGRPQKTWEDPKWGRQLTWQLTSSLDASLALVERMLPGRGWRIDKPLQGPYTVNLWPPNADRVIVATHNDLPRALLIAILKALEQAK